MRAPFTCCTWLATRRRSFLGGHEASKNSEVQTAENKAGSCSATRAHPHPPGSDRLHPADVPALVLPSNPSCNRWALPALLPKCC